MSARVSPRDSGALAAMVGPVTESREARLRRHSGGLRSCPRCRWYGFGHRWIATYGSTNNFSRGTVVWISERPARWGGAWALGCSFCADMLFRTRSDSTPRCQHRLASRWARYEVRAMALQAEHVAQHSRYEVHRVSTAAFFRPDEPLRLLLQASSDDDRLLAGAVPQPSDWLRAWSAARNPQSWQAAAREATCIKFGHALCNRGQSNRWH